MHKTLTSGDSIPTPPPLAVNDVSARYKRRAILVIFPVLGAAAIATGLAIILFANSFSPSYDATKFPGAFPSSNTDVSWQKAFEHYGIEVDGAVGEVHYVATSQDDTYPLSAYFSMQCSSVPKFMDESSFHKVGSMYDVTVLANLEGFARTYTNWQPSAPADTWYARNSPSSKQFGALVQGTAGACTVFIST